MVIGVAAISPPAVGLGGGGALGAAEIGDADGRALVHLARVVHHVALARVEHHRVGEHPHHLALQLRRVDDPARRHLLLGHREQQHAGGVARGAARQALIGGRGGGVDGAAARRDGRLDRLHVLRPADHVAVAVGVAVAHRVAEQRRVLVRHDAVIDDGHRQPREVAHRQHFAFRRRWCRALMRFRRVVAGLRRSSELALALVRCCR